MLLFADLIIKLLFYGTQLDTDGNNLNLINLGSTPTSWVSSFEKLKQKFLKHMQIWRHSYFQFGYNSCLLKCKSKMALLII